MARRLNSATFDGSTARRLDCSTAGRFNGSTAQQVDGSMAGWLNLINEVINHKGFSPHRCACQPYLLVV
jgi:hypothetical protein